MSKDNFEKVKNRLDWLEMVALDLEAGDYNVDMECLFEAIADIRKITTEDYERRRALALAAMDRE